ncbi:MAG: alpha-beta hydrolase superfamily lysophospholipase [Verrucomicrobiales bacterium]|jgi:alpha-beta hydrolase superfamily lysophospholipase
MARFSIDQLDHLILGPPGKWRTVRGVAFAYLVFTFIAHFMSGFMMYPIQDAGYDDTDEIIKLTSAGGRQISAIMKEQPGARYTILFSHGNAEDIGDLESLLVDLRDAGFSVFAYDYHGYGTSEGRPSASHTYMDIRAAYLYLTETLQIPEESIILYGRSLGCGPTIEWASTHHPGAVILESPFLSAYRVITRIPLFPFDKYKNVKKIAKVSSPVLLIYGENDEVVPPSHSKALFAKTTAQPKQLLEIKGVGHNDLHALAGREAIEGIVRFIKELENPLESR